ncbi:unnamed protein product, partial [Symbiodinium sp. CCMP2456]
MPGTGSNSTHEALKLTRWAAAEGKNIEPETIARLSELEKIQLVKEATGSMDQASQVLELTDLTLLSGDDSMTLPLMSIGGEGVISVVGNIVPGDMLNLVKAAAEGDFAEAQKMHFKLFTLCREMLGLSTNPIPIKAAMKMLGRDSGELRLPMTPLCENGEKIVYLCEYGTIYGGENSMLSGLCAVQSRGFDLAVVCPPDTALSAQLSQLGIAQIPFTWVDSTGKRKPLELLRNELAKTIPAWQADIVHANSLSVSRILGPIQRTVDVKFVGHLRDIIKLNKRVIADISMLDEIYCVSTATRDFHVAQGMAIGKSCVLHNGVDLKEFAPSKEPVESDVLRLVYIGQLVIRKAIDVLLDGVRLAIEHGANVSLDLYGERHSIKEEAQKYEADLYRFVEANRLEPHIHFRGRTDNTPEILRQSDVLVH